MSCDGDGVCKLFEGTEQHLGLYLKVRGEVSYKRHLRCFILLLLEKEESVVGKSIRLAILNRGTINRT